MMNKQALLFGLFVSICLTGCQRNQQADSKSTAVRNESPGDKGASKPGLIERQDPEKPGNQRIKSSDAVSALIMEPMGRAMALNVPLVIQFTGVASAESKQFKTETLDNDRVKIIFETGQAVLLEIDAILHPEIANQFEVKSLPSTIIMTPQGKSAKRLHGFQNAESLLTAIQVVIDKTPNNMSSTPRPLSDLVDGEQDLKDQFNDDVNKVRMIVILSPS